MFNLRRKEVMPEYSCESIGVITLKHIEKLMQPKRKQVTKKEKTILLIEQKNRCASCGSFLETNAWECDHVPRIKEAQEQKLQILCVPCHQQKSGEELSLGNAWTFQSHFAQGCR